MGKRCTDQRSIPSRLKKLGYKTYSEYLSSPHWRDLKRRYKASNLKQTCAVCDETHIELHHNTYERMGAEFLTDLTPLCRVHHEEEHGIQRSEREKASLDAYMKRLNRPKKVKGKKFTPSWYRAKSSSIRGLEEKYENKEPIPLHVKKIVSTKKSNKRRKGRR